MKNCKSFFAFEFCGFDHYETVAIIEKGIEKLNNLEIFEQFIDLSVIYHQKRCEHNDYSNCRYLNQLTCICIKNVSENNCLDKLQKFCRYYFGNFFSLTILLKSLASIEKEKKQLEEKFKKLLEIWNVPTQERIKKNLIKK